MPATRIPAAVRDLLRAAPVAAGSDADLLARFVATRDEAAFTALVTRHGGTVWDVCRAVVGNRADADDAFQAVFLLLARRAARLRKPAALGAWLHGVAVRVARKARAAAARRQAKEADRPAPPAVVPPDPSWAEVRAAVHDALDSLPGVYREALVACYLRGLTHDDTAAELGLSKAAVKKRLERGRDRLRAVLVRRGFGPAVVLAVVSTPAAVPARLLDLAARTATGAVPIPHAILHLVEGATSMTFAKLAAVAGLVAVMGIALAAGPDESPRRPPPANPPAAAPKVAGAKEAPMKATELDGTWTVKWIETSGEPLFDIKNHDETVPPPTFVFTGDRCEVKGVKLLFFGDFTVALDPTKAPKEIDATFRDGPKAGKTYAGIYVLRDDELRICFRLQGTQFGRPKGYVTNSGTTLYTFILTRAGRAAAPAPKGSLPPRVEPLRFDAVLRSGRTFYFVLDDKAGKSFPDSLAPFAERLELALATADQLAETNKVSLVLFHRHDAKGGTGSYTGFSHDQLRRIAGGGSDARIDALMAHAWTLGRLPKDAVPLPPAPPPPPAKPDAPRVGAGSDVLTADELAAVVRGKDAVGRVVEFDGTIIHVGKGIDGGIMPLVRIVSGEPDKEARFDRFYVHHIPVDAVGKAGDRVKVRGRVVSHAYGVWFLWADRWAVVEGGARPAPPAAPAASEESIYDRVRRKDELPTPGDEVKSPKDAAVVYYVTNRLRMWGEPRNAGKHPGLYVSRDAGKTWRLVNTSFEFKTLFVHPTSGDLFAAIEHAWSANDEKTGEFTRYHADKAIRSTDGGAKWKDITPPPGYIAEISRFFADPDHPGRACFVATIVRGIVFRPKDDTYSDYDRIREATPEGERLIDRGAAVGPR